MTAVGVVNHVPFLQKDGRYYMQADETRALRAWTDHFRHTVLLKPRLDAEAVPKGWEPHPGSVSAEPLYEMTREQMPGSSRTRRRPCPI